jgi:hypothetical protein
MSSYFSGLLTNTTSRYASLRSLIPSSNSEIDGDTPDDTHLCRVLRAYHIEKGRVFPSWLPPDPRAPPVVQPTYNQPHPSVGAGYGGLQNGGAGGQSKLGSLWDAQPQQQQQQQPTSLRQARGPVAGLRDPYSRMQTSSVEPAAQGRPLPIQRAGSYQNASPSSGGVGAAGGTAQDRLKARLWGNSRSSSPAPQLASPPTSAPQPQAQSSRGGYERGGSGYSGSSGNYEDTFLPDSRSGGSGGGGGGGGDKPFMAATSPWASNEQEFNGGSRQQAPNGRMGLPSGGPRRGGGLPTGPRSMR